MKNVDGVQFVNLDELMLQCLDNLSILTRKILQFASVLGSTFDFNEILQLSGLILSIPPKEMRQHSIDIQLALESAVEEGILDETLETINEGGILTSMLANKQTSQDEMQEKDDCIKDSKYSQYTFHHSSWQRLVLSLLLDSWKCDIHKYAAMAIEAKSHDADSQDYRTKVKLFQHWKKSENSLKSFDLALDIGQSYKMLGLNQHSTSVYGNALEIWKKHKPADGESLIAGKCSCVFLTVNLFDETALFSNLPSKRRDVSI